MINRQDRTEQSELALSVVILRDEVRVLRDVLDEIREALQWQNRNAEDFPALIENRQEFWQAAGATLPPLVAALKVPPPLPANQTPLEEHDRPPSSEVTLPHHELLSQVWRGDCFELFPSIPLRSVDCIFIDPPYNFGIDYGSGGIADSLPDDEYLRQMKLLIELSVERLTPTGSLWFLCPEKWADDIGTLLSLHLPRRNRIIWRETFGQYRESSFPSGHRHLFHHVMDPQHSPFLTDEIRIPSQRMLSGDKRAAGPRVPDDVWEIPRLVGNSSERIAGHPCQLPEALLERILLSSTRSGDLVLDPMAGTGTTLRVAQKLGRRYLGIEREAKFATLIQERLAKEYQSGLF